MKSSLNVRKGLNAVTSGDSNRGSVGAAQTANDKGLARPRTATTVQTRTATTVARSDWTGSLQGVP